MTRLSFLGIISFLGLAALLSGFRPLYFILFTFIGGTVVAYGWTKLQGAGLRVSIFALDDYPQAGEPLQLKVEIEERLGLQRWALRLRAGADGGGSVTFDLTAGDLIWITTAMGRLRRGFNMVGPVSLESSDPWGLVQAIREIGRETRVLVYPRTLPVSTVTAGGRGVYSDSSGSDRPLKGLSAASRVREYAAGDSLSHIHWPLSAKLDRMMIRELDDSGLGDEVLVLLDLQRSTQAGTGEGSTEEYGVTIAASLLSAMLEHEIPAGLLANGDQLYEIEPGTGGEQRATIMEALALARATGRTPLVELVHQRSQVIAAGTHVLLITPGQGETESLALREIERLGATVVPLFIDSRSFGATGASDPPYELAAAYGGVIVSLGDDLTQAMEQVMESVLGASSGERVR